MKNTKKNKNTPKPQDYIPMVCPHCGMILMYAYAGTENAKIGCFCPDCDKYTVFSVERVEGQGKGVCHHISGDAIPQNVLNKKMFCLGE